MQSPVSARTAVGGDARLGRHLVSRVLPARAWPVIVFTFGAPLCVGLALHALIDVDRWMMFWSCVAGAFAFGVGSLPAAVSVVAADEGHTITPRAGGERRYFGAFLLAAALATVAWPLLPLRLAAGVTGLVIGGMYLRTLGRGAVAEPGASRLTANVVPWCYAVGPPGAVALAALAMRPGHLGEWRDLAYLGLGRLAAGAAVLYAVVIEHELRRRYRARGESIPDALLSFRLLIGLLAVTGFWVPGGGSPYAVSWMMAWLVAAYYERRWRLS